MTSLRWEAERIEAAIRGQLERAEELLNARPTVGPGATSHPDVIAFEGECRAWHDFNEQVLEQAFDDDSEVQKYRGRTIRMVRNAETAINAAEVGVREAMAMLRSVQKRLDLYAEQGQPVRSTSTPEQRRRLLRELHGATGGDLNQVVRPQDIGNTLGLEDQALKHAVSYLQHDGMLKWVSMGTIGLTHQGRRYVEQPEEEHAQHVRQVVNIVGDVTNSNIGQAGGDVAQTSSAGLTADLVEALIDWLREVRQLELDELDAEARATLIANIETMEAQLASPAPIVGVLRTSMSVVKSVLENAAGSLAAAGIVQAGADLLKDLT